MRKQTVRAIRRIVADLVPDPSPQGEHHTWKRVGDIRRITGIAFHADERTSLARKIRRHYTRNHTIPILPRRSF